MQTEARTSIIASLKLQAVTKSAGVLSNPANFPTFSALAAASTSSRRIGKCSYLVPVIPHQSHICMGLSSLCPSA